MSSTRREFLGASAALAALSAWPRALRADAAGDPVAAAFRRALADQPWLLGFAAADREHYEARADLVDGSLPDGLRGTFYRNGPAGHEVAGRRYQHWFDGDGLVQAWRLAADGVTHRARFVATRKRERERAAGRPLVAGFGTAWPDLPDGASPAEANAANISVLDHAGRLLALWEAGDAHAIDAESLATDGVHTWSPETAGAPFSAHPRVEPDGTLWNFGSAPWAGAFLLYRITPAGALAGVWRIPLEPHAYVHDFAVTERHAVFLLPPLHWDPESTGASFLARHRWDGAAPTGILLVDKADPSRVRRLEMPACFVFHLGNAWEEADGTIHLDAFRYADASIVTGEQRQVMWGRWPRWEAPSSLLRLTLDPARGRVREERGEGNGEFPRVDPRRIGRRHRYLYALGQSEVERERGHPLFDAVVRHDLQSGERRSWRYPPGVVAEEHVFVPRAPGAPEGAGWLVGAALDTVRGRSQLAVFDAEALDAGPIAQARLPYALPLGLHGAFRSA